MTIETTTDLFRQALLTTFWLSIPILLVGLLVGVAISLIQILTSIQDGSFAALPRLVAFFVGLLVLLPWMTSHLVAYTLGLFANLDRYAR